MTIKEYARERYNDLIQTFSNDNFQRVNDSATSVANNSAWKLEDTIDSFTAGKRQSMNIWVIANDKAYEISYAADYGKQYAENLMAIQKMIDSFEFIK
jgi:hypothetical protein